MKTRRLISTLATALFVAGAAHANPLFRYDVAKITDGSQPQLTRGKNYVFQIQGLGDDGLPATSGQSSLIDLSCNGAACNVQFPTGGSPYQPDPTGKLNVIIRFDTAPQTVSIRAQHNTNPSINGTLPGLTIQPFPTTFNIALSGGPNVTAEVPFDVTITALDSGGGTVSSFKDNITVSDDIVGDIATVFASDFVNGSVTKTLSLNAGQWDTHINHVKARSTVKYVGQSVEASGSSNNVNVAPGAYNRIILLFPGETPTPGLAPGKSGTPTDQVASQGINNVLVYAVDHNYNQLNSNFPAGLTISFASSINSDTLPGSMALTSNPLNLTGLISLKGTLGLRTITATPSINPTNPSQSAVRAIPGTVDHYAFTIQPPPSGTPLEADGSFQIQITAYDAGNFIKTDLNGPLVGAFTAELLVGGSVQDSGPQYIDTDPSTLLPDNTIKFTNGVATTNMLITREWNEARLSFDGDGVANVIPPIKSNTWRIIPGTAKQVFMTIKDFGAQPGETYLPGQYPGNTGTPPVLTAGQSVRVEMRLTDGRWNVVSGSLADNTSVTPLGDNSAIPKYIDASPTGAIDFPSGGQLFGASAPLITFRSSGSQVLRAQASGSYGFTSASSQIQINPGTYSRLMLVGPGETAQPGIPSSTQADGKIGSVTDQLVGQPFTVHVVATDALWNPINTAGYPVINFNVQDPTYQIAPSVPMQMGTANEPFSITLQSLSLPDIEVFDNTVPGDASKRQKISVNTTPGVVNHFRLILGTLNPKQAGIPFAVTIQAEDQFNNVIPTYTDTIALDATTGAGTMSPATITLTNGVFAGNITMFAKGTNVKVNMTKGVITSQSPAFNVLNHPGGYTRLLLLLPGEIMTPGASMGTVGKSGTVTPNTVGLPNTVTVVSCDQFFNPIAAVGTVQLASNKYANFANATGDLNINTNGYGEFSTTVFLKTAGVHTISVKDVNLDGTVARSSSTITALVGAYKKIQLLVPGQVADPGSDTGKTNAAILTQKAGVPFTVTMNAVDDFWNIVPSINDGDTHLDSNVSAIQFNPPNNADTVGNDPRPFTIGVSSRDVIVGQQGLTQITASDKARPTLEGQTVEIPVNPGPTYVITAPANAIAGTPFNVTISLEENGSVLTTANNTVSLTATLASGGSATGALTPDSVTLTNGQATIPNMTYAYVERIKIKVSDTFNRVGFSNDVEVAPSGLRYDVVVPTTSVVAGPPATFNVTVRLLDKQNGTLVKNHDHKIDVAVVSALNLTTDGAYSVTTANLAQGVVTFAQSYTKAESISILISEDGVDGNPTFTIPSKTSQNILVKADGYKKLLIIAPGETHVPGVQSLTGKTGTANTRQLGVPFLVQVRGVDQYWNEANDVSGGQIHFDSDDVPASLNSTNPANQNAPLVNGESAANIKMLNAGQFNVRVIDASNSSIAENSVQLKVGGNVYDITTPAVSCVGDPTAICAGAQFTMNVTLRDSLTGNVVTGANHTIQISALNPDGTPATGVLGVTEANILNGVVGIPDQSYSTAQDIKLRVVEKTTNEIKNTGTSSTIHFISRQVRYSFTMPADALVNSPFTIHIQAIDQDTGTEVKNLNRTCDLVAFSAVTGLPVTGTFVPSGTGVVNIVNGAADVSAVYNVTEPIFMKMTDNTPPNQPSSPTQAVFTSAGTILIKPGALASIVDLRTGQPMADWTMRSNEGITFNLSARDTFNNPIPNQKLRIRLLTEDAPAPMSINGTQNDITQKDNAQGELNVLMQPDGRANGTYRFEISDADVVNGYKTVVTCTVNGLPSLPASARALNDRIPMNTTYFLPGISDIHVASYAVVDIYYAVDGHRPYTLYDAAVGIKPVDPARGYDIFTEARSYPLEWYINVYFNGDRSHSVSSLDVNGGPARVTISTIKTAGKLVAYPTPFSPMNGSQNFTRIQYPIPASTSAEIKIYDLFGQPVWHYNVAAGEGESTDGTFVEVPWTGRNDDGTVVANGGYIIVVKIAGGGTERFKVLVVK